MEAARRVDIPVLLIVGEHDSIVLDLNREVYDVLPGVKELSIVRRAGHLFEEPGALDEAARLAAGWFHAHLGKPVVIPSSHESTGGSHVITKG
jgi:putative phosphoribosyl transferase